MANEYYNSYWNHIGSGYGNIVGTENISLRIGSSYMQFGNLNPTAANQGSLFMYVGINIEPSSKIPGSNYPFVMTVSAKNGDYKPIGYYNLPKLSRDNMSVGTAYGNSFRVNYAVNTTGIGSGAGGNYPTFVIINQANYTSYVYDGAILYVQLYVDAGIQRTGLVRNSSNIFLS